MSDADEKLREPDRAYLSKTHYSRKVRVGSRTHGGEPEYAEACARCKETWPCSVVSLLDRLAAVEATLGAVSNRARATERNWHEAAAERDQARQALQQAESIAEMQRRRAITMSGHAGLVERERDAAEVRAVQAETRVQRVRETLAALGRISMQNRETLIEALYDIGRAAPPLAALAGPVGVPAEQPERETALCVCGHRVLTHGYSGKCWLCSCPSARPVAEPLVADPPAQRKKCTGLNCDRVEGHPGMHQRCCYASPGCTERHQHRGTHTTALWSPLAQGWAESEAVLCSAKFGIHGIGYVDYPDDYPNPPYVCNLRAGHGGNHAHLASSAAADLPVPEETQ